MTSPVEEWHKIHVTHEMVWNLQNWQASNPTAKIWNWHEEPCSSTILPDLISDLRLLDSFISYQKGKIWWSFQRDDEWYKGSSSDSMQVKLGINTQWSQWSYISGIKKVESMTREGKSAWHWKGVWLEFNVYGGFSMG